jgi:hypothetical protein
MASLLDLAQARLQGLLDIPTRVGRAVVNPTLFSGLLGAPTLPKETGMAQAAYGLPAQPNMSVLDPEQRAYLEGYAQGEPYSYLGMAAPFAAPSVTAGAKAVAPKAGMALENYMASQGLLQPLTAYHGTPHTIRGQFDISKVGTGEGAQAYGHGMYFAENPEVAQGYRIALSYDPDKMRIAGKQINDYYNQIQNAAAKVHPSKATAEYEKLEILENLMMNRMPDELQSSVSEMSQATQKWFEKTVKPSFETYGNLYKVDIPDEYIPNMLDWDKPFSKQTEQVKEAIKKIEPKIKQINPDINVEKLTGEQIYRAYQQYRGNQPDFASEGLNELGIKGIRYLDQGSRNPGFSSLTPTQLQARIESLQESINSGTGNTQVLKDKLKSLQNEMDSYKNMTSNFVVFDPTDVKILEKNSEKVEGLLE